MQVRKTCNDPEGIFSCFSDVQRIPTDYSGYIYVTDCNGNNDKKSLKAQDQPGQDAKSLGVAGRQLCGIMRPHHPTQRSLANCDLKTPKLSISM